MKQKLAAVVRHALAEPSSLRELARTPQAVQILLSLRYRELLQRGGPFPTFNDIQFRSFSQNGEDGILLYIFSLIGSTNRKAVEVCAGDGIECNTTNLIVHHGWTGLLFDGSERKVARGREFFARCPDTHIWPPTFVQAWVTAENVNSVISAQGFSGEIDLLSLDLDGMDYWIWKAIACITPRVVVVEYLDILGPDRAVTVPYDPGFRVKDSQCGLGYSGASLPAFVKLGREKGYRLVGCERYGFNAFFIRAGIAEGLLPEVSASSCFDHPKVRHGMETRFPRVRNREWVEV